MTAWIWYISKVLIDVESITVDTPKHGKRAVTIKQNKHWEERIAMNIKCVQPSTKNPAPFNWLDGEQTIKQKRTRKNERK